MIEIKEVEKAPIHMFDLDELACAILGLDYDKLMDDNQDEVIEEQMFEQLNTDIDVLGDIVARLLPLIDVGLSGLTEKKYKGFADTDKKVWIIKTEI